MRIVTPAQLANEYPCYADMAELAVIFTHQIILDDHDTLRWKENIFMSRSIGHTADPGLPMRTPAVWEAPYTHQNFKGAIDLNNLFIEVAHGRIPLEEYMKFEMQIGYSLCGYSEVFGQREVTEFNLEYFEEPPEDHNFDEEYWETPLEYMRKKYKNRICYT